MLLQAEEELVGVGGKGDRFLWEGEVSREWGLRIAVKQRSFLRLQLLISIRENNRYYLQTMCKPIVNSRQSFCTHIPF